MHDSITKYEFQKWKLFDNAKVSSFYTIILPNAKGWACGLPPLCAARPPIATLPAAISLQNWNSNLWPSNRHQDIRPTNLISILNSESAIDIPAMPFWIRDKANLLLYKRQKNESLWLLNGYDLQYWVVEPVTPGVEGEIGKNRS